MKNILLSSVVTALLMFSGCSDKEVVVEDPSATSNASSGMAAGSNTEVVSPENSLVNGDSMNGSNMSLEELQSQFASVYFDFDKFNLSDAAQQEISAAVSAIGDKANNINIKLEGNCDEWGSDEYNFALGLKRASSVKKALVAEGVDADHISMVSFGESNPVCREKTQECWAKNRRVDFKVLP